MMVLVTNFTYYYFLFVFQIAAIQSVWVDYHFMAFINPHR